MTHFVSWLWAWRSDLWPQMVSNLKCYRQLMYDSWTSCVAFLF